MANTIADKLTYLNGTKDAIKQAIIGKGVDVTDTDTFRSYADKISSIQTGGSIAGIPSGMRFANSTFTTVPVEIFPYLEQQTDLTGIFENCKSLTTVSQFDTSNVTDMSSMFNGCTSLQTVPQFDTSKVTDMSSMFRDCTSLQTVPLFDTSNVTNMASMFSLCTLLQTVPLFNTSNVTDMIRMFSVCTSLQTVPQFDTSKVTNMITMFYGCTSLQTVPLFDTSNVTDMAYIFDGCTSLTNLGGIIGLKDSIFLNQSTLLTVDSVMNIINYAEDISSSGSSNIIYIHPDVFSKLTEEHIATATAKGWKIASYER